MKYRSHTSERDKQAIQQTEPEYRPCPIQFILKGVHMYFFHLVIGL